MRTIEASQAPLSDLLDGSEQGETVLITREGRPVAHLVIGDGAGTPSTRAFDELRAFRKTMPRFTLEDVLSWRHADHSR